MHCPHPPPRSLESLASARWLLGRPGPRLAEAQIVRRFLNDCWAYRQVAAISARVAPKQTLGTAERATKPLFQLRPRFRHVSRHLSDEAAPAGVRCKHVASSFFKTVASTRQRPRALRKADSLPEPFEPGGLVLLPRGSLAAFSASSLGSAARRTWFWPSEDTLFAFDPPFSSSDGKTRIGQGDVFTVTIQMNENEAWNLHFDTKGALQTPKRGIRNIACASTSTNSSGRSGEATTRSQRSIAPA
jgi:hypothetical protein